MIAAGKSSDSRLVHLVAGVDAETGRMPPVDEGEPLTRKQIATLRAWIDAGAKWPDKLAGGASAADAAKHWSFQPKRAAARAGGEKQSLIRNPLDAFILAKLEAAGVQPAAEADRVTLLRRLHLDLIGLPPSPAEIDAFLADERADAYERLVDRLLESAHYGERYGRLWLDAARYLPASASFSAKLLKLLAEYPPVDLNCLDGHSDTLAEGQLWALVPDDDLPDVKWTDEVFDQHPVIDIEGFVGRDEGPDLGIEFPVVYATQWSLGGAGISIEWWPPRAGHDHQAYANGEYGLGIDYEDDSAEWASAVRRSRRAAMGAFAFILGGLSSTVRRFPRRRRRPASP